MEAKPKRSRKYTFFFLFLGFLFLLAVLGIISAVGLLSVNQIFTFENLVSLHTSYPVFLLIDVLALLCFLLLVWVGLEKDGPNSKQPIGSPKSPVRSPATPG
jgi:hypothetical protein